MREWISDQLGRVCDVARGTTITQRQTAAGNVPVVAGGIMPTYFHSIANRPANTITISGSGASAGYVNFYKVPIFASDCSTVRPKDTDRLDVRFVYYFLKSKQQYISTKLRQGAAQPHVYAKDIARLSIGLPCSSEQQRIVSILDEAFSGLFAANANVEKNLENARELFEAAVVSDIFGDADKRGWASATVSELALARKGSIRTGPFGSQLLHGEFVDYGIAVLGIDNAVENEFRWAKRRFITPEKFAQLSRYQVRPGDVLITIMGTCGRCAIVPDDIPVAINTKHLCCISLNQTRCLPRFLHAYFLYHPVARRFLAEQAKGSIMDGLNMGIIQRMPVRFPPLPEQWRIVDKIDLLRQDSKRLEANYRNMIKMIEDLKQAILQKAFSGELTSPPAQIIKEAAE